MISSLLNGPDAPNLLASSSLFVPDYQQGTEGTTHFSTYHHTTPRMVKIMLFIVLSTISINYFNFTANINLLNFI